MTDLVADFADLFEGRHDAYGRETGGCVRITPAKLPLGGSYQQHWEWTVGNHLSANGPSVGVYPIVATYHWYGEDCAWGVKWGCVDIDIRTDTKPSGDYETEEECHEAAVNLQSVLRHLGVTSWIERTRSCGRHVWVFCSNWVAAGTMRRALLFASSIAGTPTREINPKQETLSNGQLGNYVRLPYPGVLGDPAKYAPYVNRCMVTAANVPLDFHKWLSCARSMRVTPQKLAEVAARYVPPRKPRIEAQPYTGTGDGALRQLRAAGKAVFFDGPADGDRSKGLSYLAYQCRLSGLSQAEAYAIVQDADVRWGKFSTRNDGEKRLMEVVQHAWR